MKGRTRSVALCLLAISASAAFDAKEAVQDARISFLAGRYEDAASSWRYLCELGVSTPEPEANLALTLRDQGQHEASMAQWLKASLLDNADGFTWNQRAWSYLAVGRHRDARDSFNKAIERSSTTATQAEANVGLGMSFILDAKPRAAQEPLQRAGMSGPFAISAAAQLTGEAALALGDRQTALTYYRQAIEVDPFNFEALRAVARLLELSGDNRSAWRAYKRLLSLDPKDAAMRKSFDRVSRFITGDHDSAAGVRRLTRPILNADADTPALPVSSRTIRVGLYGAPDGRPAMITRAYVMSNSAFKVTSLGHGVLRDNGRAFDQWEVSFRSESGLVEVRDASRNILFTSKLPFTFVPNAPRGSTLVKSVQVADPVGVDIGDREVRAAVEVVPSPWGFRLVQVAPLEQYLIGVVSLAMPQDAPPQALRAQAVVSRTAAVWSAENRPETLEHCDLLDDDSVQRTIGISGEMRAAAEAVNDTEAILLTVGGRAAKVMQHADSGGTTEEGAASGEEGLEHLVSIQDSVKARAPWSTVAELERFTHEAPPEGLFSEGAVLSTPASARWMRIITEADLRERVSRRKDLGWLRQLLVSARAPSGRIRAIEVVGSQGRALYQGRRDIEELLGPGSLRSTLFTVQPLLDGRRLSRVVIWGAGTGHGLGFPRAGAMGQAGLGTPWREILRRYFPGLDIKNPLLVERPAAKAAPRVGPYRRSLNFHKRKK
ncbi:MAG: SpoIID/LytB domain-containing protein [Elusimicrobiota bacterium]